MVRAQRWELFFEDYLDVNTTAIWTEERFDDESTSIGIILCRLFGQQHGRVLQR